jgi:hypothetical protein
MTEVQQLYDRATKILTNIEVIKSISQNLLDESAQGILLDKKELLNLAHSIKKLMEKYNDILECLSKSNISFEEKENIMDVLDNSRKSILTLNNAIRIAQNKKI